MYTTGRRTVNTKTSKTEHQQNLSPSRKKKLKNLHESLDNGLVKTEQPNSRKAKTNYHRRKSTTSVAKAQMVDLPRTSEEIQRSI